MSSGKRRLLMYFSYIGTNYRGLQRNTPTHPLAKRDHCLESIQGILEFGLQKVLWLNRVPVFISSRTDTKVHAVESTVQFDLWESDFFAKSKRGFSPEVICQGLNLFLDKNECDIRVKRIVEVPTDFNCRKAYSRVYEFRVAVLNEAPHNTASFVHLSSCTDIRELYRCEITTQPFSISAVQEACNLFLGKWNFTTFMKTSGEVVPEEKRFKTIRRFTFTKEDLPDRESGYFPGYIDSPAPYDIYTFTVEGSGFLRRQVRRMVGALVGVGRGVIAPEKITWMLKNPSEKNWPPGISSLGPNGLYLKQINYSDLNVLRGYLS